MPGYLHRHTAKTPNNSNRFPGRRPGEKYATSGTSTGTTTDDWLRRATAKRSKFGTAKSTKHWQRRNTPNLMLAITKRYPNRKSKQDWTRRLGNYVDIEFYCTVGTWRCRGMAVFNKGYGRPQSRKSGKHSTVCWRNGDFVRELYLIWTYNLPRPKSRRQIPVPVVSLVPNESPDNVLKVRKAWEPVKQLGAANNGGYYQTNQRTGNFLRPSATNIYRT